MATVTVQNLTRRFAGKPPTTAVDDVTLEIPEGEFLVLLGPSGCGKTTTLRCVAGLESPDTGKVSFGDNVMFDSSRRVNLPPDKRRIGMVFQSYALWPHMTVRKNIGYPLRAHKIKGARAKEMIVETAELVDCAPLLDRYPGQLSGGQQQRVALARGLVAQPDVVLFDEPLSNLDARLRDMVRAQLHELHQRLRFTAVFVTHDQREALALGDRLAIMRAGQFEQVDTPERVFEEPATEYVADFIGMSNRLPVERTGDGWQLGGRAVTGAIPVDASYDEIAVRVRPDDIVIAPAAHGLPNEAVHVPADVVDSQFGGREMDVVVTVGETRVQARVSTDACDGFARTLRPGQQVIAGFLPNDAIYCGPDGARVTGQLPVELGAAGVG